MTTVCSKCVKRCPYNTRRQDTGYASKHVCATHVKLPLSVATLLAVLDTELLTAAEHSR